MSTRLPSPEIINAVQAGLLQALLDNHRSPMTLDALRTAAGLRHSVFTREQIDLRERGLLLATPVPIKAGGKRSRLMISLTRVGKRSLLNYKLRAKEAESRVGAAVPDKSNLFYRPVLRVLHITYTRNNGNAHIPSRGVRC